MVKTIRLAEPKSIGGSLLVLSHVCCYHQQCRAQRRLDRVPCSRRLMSAADNSSSSTRRARTARPSPARQVLIAAIAASGYMTRLTPESTAILIVGIWTNFEVRASTQAYIYQREIYPHRNGCFDALRAITPFHTLGQQKIICFSGLFSSFP